MRVRKDSGFSLLEIIIVLAIAGGVMVMYTHYARKKAENIAQQNVADALAEEMKGVLEFIDDDTIALVGQKNETDSPLYSNEKDEYNVYHTRITNEIDTTDTGNKDNYYLWGDSNNKSRQQRYLFLSSNCKSSLKSDFAFEKEYLSCFMRNVATNSTAVIDRVGFASGDKDSDRQYDINRIDTIVRFKKEEANTDYHFADFAPHFTEAFSKAGFTVSHSMIVHRTNSTSNWQLVLNKKDNKTPIELSSMASNLDALDQYKKDEFGVRFTIETNDNSGNSSNVGGKVCWARGDSGVKLCYDDNVGTGKRGEDTVLSLNMTDPNNTRGEKTMTGTLKANVVMENTATRVNLFQRSAGSLKFDDEGNPQPLHRKDADGNLFTVELTGNDSNAMYNVEDGADGGFELDAPDYPDATFDAYELVTPSVTFYSEKGFNTNDNTGLNLDSRKDDAQTFNNDENDEGDLDININSYSDDGGNDDRTHSTDPEVLSTTSQGYYDINGGGYRYAVQTCPQVEQEITLRDRNGKPLLDDEGNVRRYKYTRRLYPRMTASISSVAAFRPSSTAKLSFQHSDQTRNTLTDNETVGSLAGLAVQVEIAEQANNYNSFMNSAGHHLYDKTKYIWVVSAIMGMYDGATGEGYNVLNPGTVSYVFHTWCSTIPQDGTPADILDTQQYQ
ncbi:type II secretion system protein [Enterobacter sp. ECC-019]|uniref:type II secretion system protein n=1 Tax=Enterobacter sp. ECC-019 TaxID=3116478 RepID=UPI0037546814